MLTIALATLTASGTVAAGIMIVILLGGLRGFPRFVLLIDWLLSLICVGGLRLTVRLLAEGGQIGRKPTAWQANAGWWWSAEGMPACL